MDNLTINGYGYVNILPHSVNLQARINQGHYLVIENSIIVDFSVKYLKLKKNIQTIKKPSFVNDFTNHKPLDENMISWLKRIILGFVDDRVNICELQNMCAKRYRCYEISNKILKDAIANLRPIHNKSQAFTLPSHLTAQKQLTAYKSKCEERQIQVFDIIIKSIEIMVRDELSSIQFNSWLLPKSLSDPLVECVRDAGYTVEIIHKEGKDCWSVTNRLMVEYMN